MTLHQTLLIMQMDNVKALANKRQIRCLELGASADAARIPFRHNIYRSTQLNGENVRSPHSLG